MKVKDILQAKGTRVITIDKEVTVFNVINLFAGNRVGSLLVADNNNKVLGIVTARDVLMAVSNHLDEIKTMTVEKIMSTNLIVGTEDDEVDYIQAIITENRIRHIPIMDGDTLCGMVSIGDVVKAQLKEQAVENRYLKDYIADRYPG